jgi:MFS family permease
MNILKSNIFRFFIQHSSWLVAVSFLLFQFFLQLSSGVIIGAIMHDMHLSAFIAGLLSGTFYVIYTGLQIPVGILFDHKNARRLLSVNAFICSIGCFLFATSHGLIGLFLGRLLIGSGSAFAFIGLSLVLRQQYPIKQFAFMIGLSETLGFTATVIGMILLGSIVEAWGWRGFINTAGIVGLIISYLCWHCIQDHEQRPQKRVDFLKKVFQILKNPTAWINGIFVGLCFTVVTTFGALWAIPFIRIKLNCDLQTASLISALFFLGTGLSCPLFGILSNHLSKRKPLILSSCLSTAILLLILLYSPKNHYLLTGLLMFLIGLCCGAYMLAYSIANELAPKNSQSTMTGFTNTLAMVTTPLLQPLIGYLLDHFNHSGIYSLQDYQQALLTIPASLLLASVLVILLPEKKQRL